MLTGKKILITRPAAQAVSLQQQLQAQGALPYAFPFVVISPLADTPAFKAAAALLPTHLDKIIVTSANVVFTAQSTLTHIKAHYPNAIWYAIGPGTTKALHHANIETITAKAPYHSEQLLELLNAELLEKQNILLLTGKGGRDLLMMSLCEAGAMCYRLDCYERTAPNHITTLETFLALPLDAIVITSTEGMLKVFDMLSSQMQTQFLKTPLIVQSERAANIIQKLGFQKIIVSVKADEAGLLQALNTL